jgi:hypothetical protein
MKQIILLLLISNYLFAQKSDIIIQPILGSSLFYVNEKEVIVPDEYWYRHHQMAFGLDFGHDLFKKYYRTGLEAKLLLHWGGADKYKNIHYLFGWYNQFNMTAKTKKLRLFLELGIHVGNLYLAKYAYKTDKMPGLFYLGAGYGAGYRIKKNLYIYGSVTLYPLLNYQPFYYYYGNYEFGLEWHFEKLKS